MKKRDVIMTGLMGLVLFLMAFSFDGEAYQSDKGLTTGTLTESLNPRKGRLQAVMKNTSKYGSGIEVKEYTISSSSKYRQYLWRDAKGNIPDYTVYIFKPENFNGHTVFIDAGHGDNSFAEVREKREKVYPVPDKELSGMNTGKVGSNAFDIGVEARDALNVHNNFENEPQFALKIALKVKDKLLRQGYCVVMSRISDNQNLSNGARSVLAGETSDVMISIHSNASIGRRSSGTLALYPGDKDYLSGEVHPGYTEIMGLTQHEQSSKKLAEIMSSAISQKTGMKNLGAGSAVLRIFSYSSIPTCLVEVGFADNAIDAKILTEKKEEISEAIAEGVNTYFSK